ARDGCELADHLAVEVRPGRLAVEQEHRCALALVDVMHPQAVLLDVVRREFVAREVDEALVGRAVRAHAKASITRGRSGGGHESAGTGVWIRAAANSASRSRCASTGPSRKISRTRSVGVSSSARARSPAFHASTSGPISSPRPSQRKNSVYTGTVA